PPSTRPTPRRPRSTPHCAAIFPKRPRPAFVETPRSSPHPHSTESLRSSSAPTLHPKRALDGDIVRPMPHLRALPDALADLERSGLLRTPDDHLARASLRAR